LYELCERFRRDRDPGEALVEPNAAELDEVKPAE
jgi:hypothetical protein